jgi:hypothetical protein
MTRKTKTKPGMPQGLLDLMERYIRVAMLLPKKDAIAAGEYDRAEIEMVFDQLKVIGRQMHVEYGIPDFGAEPT